MLSLVIWKELRGIIVSPKFVATFVICSVLILLSVIVGVHEYRIGVRQYEAALRLTDQAMRTQASWMGLATNAYRKPDPAQIFVTGVNNDIGRMYDIGRLSGVKLKDSPYSDDPIFAFFRALDLSFIVMVVLSLFAVLFTYDAINGEREGGTLQLTFANPLSRWVYITGKVFGAWLGLVIPLAIPVLIGIGLVAIQGIPLRVDMWERIVVFLGISLLYVTFFIVFGVMTSALTRRSSVSFLLALVAWVAFVLVIPRLGVMAAGEIKAVPSVAEVEAQADAYAKDRWEKHQEALTERCKERQASMAGMSEQERIAYREANSDKWMNEDDAQRKQVQQEIEDYRLRLDEDLRNRTDEQQQLAFTLTRFSPASAYQLASMNVAGTDITLKRRYEQAMREYRMQFVQYVEKNAKETGNTGGFRITIDSDTGFKFSAPRERGTLDLGGLPVFVAPQLSIAGVMSAVVVDAGILALFSIMGFAVASIAFLRYDLR